MPNRAEVQDAHESSVLAAAIEEHNRIHGLCMKVILRPDPPDAILSDGSTTTWMEHTDAFFSADWARDLNSKAADEPHQPMAKGVYVDMDARFANVFCDRLITKAAKSSYKSWLEQYGPGIIVVGLESPWLDDETLNAIDEQWTALGNPDVSSTFAHVYLGYRNGNGNKALKWPRS